MGDVVLDKVLVVFANGDVQPFVGDQASFVKGIFVGMTQSDELVVAVEVREREGRHPAHGCEGGVACPLELLGERRELLLVRHLVEAANAHIDGVDFPAAEQAHDLVCRLLLEKKKKKNIKIIINKSKKKKK